MLINYLFSFFRLLLRYLVHNTYAHLQGSPAGGRVREDEVTGGGAGDEFRSHNHAERMMRRLEQYAGKRQLCDVTLVAEDRRLPAHRFVITHNFDNP